jgi:hypothetical protein
MFKPISVLVLSALVLTSCGTVRESRFNPVNWFGRSESRPVSVDPNTNPLIPARNVSIFRQDRDEGYRGWDLGEITELVIERRPGGAIVRATAVADQQGAFDLKMVKIDEESDATTLTYAFRGIQPRGAQGSPDSRTHSVAVWLTDNELLGIKVIQIKGARNVRTVRR